MRLAAWLPTFPRLQSLRAGRNKLQAEDWPFLGACSQLTQLTISWPQADRWGWGDPPGGPGGLGARADVGWRC